MKLLTLFFLSVDGDQLGQEGGKLEVSNLVDPNPIRDGSSRCTAGTVFEIAIPSWWYIHIVGKLSLPQQDILSASSFSNTKEGRLASASTWKSFATSGFTVWQKLILSSSFEAAESSWLSAPCKYPRKTKEDDAEEITQLMQLYHRHPKNKKMLAMT